jgi:hypothetical protein
MLLWVTIPHVVLAGLGRVKLGSGVRFPSNDFYLVPIAASPHAVSDQSLHNMRHSEITESRMPRAPLCREAT